MFLTNLKINIGLQTKALKLKNRYLNAFALKATAFAFLFMLFSLHGTSQNEQADTSSVVVKKHSAKKATLFSTFVPGLGQIYNGKWWKAPVIYAGAATFVYFIDFNNKNYQDFKLAYKYRIDNDSTTVDPYLWASKETLLKEKDRWRRYRDLNIIGLTALYMLNIIDANVDAHFFDYDISNDLSLNVQPLFVKPETLLGAVQPAYPVGLSFRLTF